MFQAITRRLDRIAIASACRSVRGCEGVEEVGTATVQPDALFAVRPPSANLVFSEGGAFSYPSPAPSGWAENDTVVGRIVAGRKKAGRDSGRPVVILLHGWNGEQGYRFLFPPLARRFAWLGLTVAMIELPYHGSRKPRRGRLRNFLSGDIMHMMEATGQTILDIRALIGWLDQEGYGPISFWGVSLGAWLGGLAASVEERLSAGVLVAPVPRIDQAIADLDFCRHIQASVETHSISPASLNLREHRPRIHPKDILIVEPIYDLFASADSVEELWRAWGEPEIWRVKHGHISVLFSLSIMNQTGHWLSRREGRKRPEKTQKR